MLRAEQVGNHVAISVEDDGPGIAPHERERVLERFYRVPGTPGTGSGLGEDRRRRHMEGRL